MTILPHNQDNQKINVSSPEQKGFLSRNLNRILGVSVSLIVILGIILVGLGSAGVIPLVAGLVPGLIFICSPLVIGVSRYLRLSSSTKKLSPMRSDLIKHAEKYCLNFRKTSRHNDDLQIGDRSTNIIFDKVLSECKSEIVKNIYLENKEIMKTFLDQGFKISKDRILVYTASCFSMYYIIQKMILQRDALFNSLRLTSADGFCNNGKLIPVDDAILQSTPLPRLCLFFAPWRDFEMNIFRVGVSSFLEGYYFLRQLVNEEEFYKPNTDYYQLRLMFNDIIQKMDEIFDLQKVKEEFPKFKSKLTQRKDNIANLLYWSFVKDEEPNKHIFMRLVQEASQDNYAIPSRNNWDLFYS